MRKIRTVFVLVSFFMSIEWAQGQDFATETEKDTASLGYRLKNGGRFHGRVRNYFSATINQKSLTDYYAWAIGVGAGYQSPRLFKYFSVGISAFSAFNVAATPMKIPDPATNQPNRYEIGLFNLEDPDSRQDLTRLEELFAKVHIGKKSSLTIGRQLPQTPFINPQDGRMSPTFTEAAVMDFSEWKYIRIHGEYIWKIAPRSTVRWYGIGESMGLYPVGVNTEGGASAYKGNTTAGGIGMLGIIYQKKQWLVELWDMHIDNVLNTALVKTEWRAVPSGGGQLTAGVQYIRQQTVGNGGSAIPARAYAMQGNEAHIISGRFGWQSPRFTWFLNATRISGDGRYLMPREWGKEPFYTFLPRERNEGFGNLSAVSVNTIFRVAPKTGVELSGGYYQLPDVRNYTLNKYGMPSYTQVNASVVHQFDKYLKGMEARLLIVRKDNAGETYGNDRFVFNKVNMTHLNFIINYHF